MDSRRSSTIVHKESSEYQSILPTVVISNTHTHTHSTVCVHLSVFVCVTAGVTQNGHVRKGESRCSMYGDPGTPDINEVKQRQPCFHFRWPVLGNITFKRNMLQCCFAQYNKK